MSREEGFCGDCMDVIEVRCQNEVIQPIEIKDTWVSNSIVDVEFGITANLNSKEVIEILITEIKRLKKKIK